MLIRNATEEDIPAAGAVAAAAYIDDEQDAFMFPGRMKHPQRYLKTKESIVRHGMEESTATVIVATLEEGDEGWSGRASIVGFCIWFREDSYETREKVQSAKKKQPLLSSESPSRAILYRVIYDYIIPL